MDDTPADKPPSKGEQTRAAIVEAAYSLFLKHGFHGATMRQIADGAGLALGGIYNYFDSKEAIFAAVLDTYHPYRQVLPQLEQADGDTVEAFIRDAARRARPALAGAETRLLPLMFIEIVEFQGRHLSQLAEMISPALFKFAQSFAGRRGKLRPVPLPVMLRMFIGLFAGYLLTELVLKNTPALAQGQEDAFEGMVDIYLHGIVEPEA
jgi:AcrR family transcriptional regulator